VGLLPLILLVDGARSTLRVHPASTPSIRDLHAIDFCGVTCTLVPFVDSGLQLDSASGCCKYMGIRNKDNL